MKFRYTITTETEECPNCGNIIKEKSRGGCTPIFASLWMITLPLMLIYFLIRYLGFGDPDVPKVGPKVISCPYCSSKLKTSNYSVDELSAEGLINYKFRMWFYVGYALGGVIFFAVLYLLLDSLPIISICGLIIWIATIGLFTIIISYRILIAKSRNKNRRKYNKRKFKCQNSTKNASHIALPKLQFFGAYKTNYKRLINICQDLIDEYEDKNSATPSCKDDLMKMIKNRICNAKEEISQWKDFDTDYIQIAHSMLANTTFDLLASGRYNIYTGIINPMKCGSQLLRVYDASMQWAVNRGEISEDIRIEQRSCLIECISKVG